MLEGTCPSPDRNSAAALPQPAPASFFSRARKGRRAMEVSKDCQESQDEMYVAGNPLTRLQSARI